MGMFKNNRMLKNPLKIIFLTLFLFVGNFANAYAWGHLKYLNNEWGDSALIHRVLDDHAISYCIDIKDNRFNYKSIETQLKMALLLWLKPLEDVGIFGVSVLSTDCLKNSFDLKIEIGPDFTYPNLSAFNSTENDNQHKYSLIKINSAYVYKDDDNNKIYEQIDFEKIVPKDQNLREFLQDISIVNLTTPDDLSDRLKLDSRTVYMATYNSILHELGHSFGLCDLGKESINVNCDPLYMSVGPNEIQPKAQMNDANYFYLTDDDKEGLKSLVSRFLNHY